MLLMYQYIKVPYYEKQNVTRLNCPHVYVAFAKGIISDGKYLLYTNRVVLNFPTCIIEGDLSDREGREGEVGRGGI